MSAATIYTHASALETANGNSGDLSVSSYETVAIDLNVTDKQGSNPTIQLLWDRKGADGVYYPVWDSTALSVSGASGGSPVQKSTSIGPGCAYNQEPGALGRLRWVIGGTSTPGATFSISIQGK